MILRAEITKMFFDKPKVTRAVSDGCRAALSKAGAFIRQKAKTSIRKRKKPSSPGKPPSSHAGSLRNNILFGYEPQNKTVVVGPVGFNGSDAPTMLEFGGKTKRVQVKTVKGKRKLVKKTAVYRARPFMQPALDQNIKAIPATFTGVVKG